MPAFHSITSSAQARSVGLGSGPSRDAVVTGTPYRVGSTGKAQCELRASNFRLLLKCVVSLTVCGPGEAGASSRMPVQSIVDAANCPAAEQLLLKREMEAGLGP